MIKSSSRIPLLLLSNEEKKPQVQLKISVKTAQQITNTEGLPQKHKKQFNQKGATHRYKDNLKEVYLSPKGCSAFKIEESCQIQFSDEVLKLSDFVGIACQLLSSGYQFRRKTQQPEQIKIYVSNEESVIRQIFNLVNSKNRSRELANGRGDIEGSPDYFINFIESIKNEYNLKTHIIKGQQLLNHGFRLLHAVGRASSKQPVFANIAYNGDPNSDQYIAFVGKGVCFDTGGLDIKHPPGMKMMFLDKHGACSVLAAFEQIVKQKLPINITCSVGLVQNFIGSKSYRPSDIIKSRKGLTVKIDDTDAEGRLVLADAMHWTQQNFKVKVLLQLSTLTYCNILALGSKYSGLYSNSDNLCQKLFKLGKNTHEHVWRMPVDQQHHQLLDCKYADCSSDNAGDFVAGASVAGAFLQKFVQKNVQWAHLDIAGTSINGQIGTGWGVILLVQYIKSLIKQEKN